ncbi:hypothetical protein SY83_19490 [Paenibacillus swuensis]|uniref:Uncharacterized protein n=1 Tax=Paenibacillus swuensis TaxID=1178515 RepID=A0A172TM09_9BACL|nr:hypothetical protein [Paenibacillus swuensis]ANE48109.1 hypothetical protein SY83_19490 [Paenibacillus swuensis]
MRTQTIQVMKKNKQFLSSPVRAVKKHAESKDHPLQEFYKLMLEYGTPKTKQQILQMGLASPVK